MEELKMKKPQNPLADQIDEFMPKVVDTLGSSSLEAVEAVEAEAETLLRQAEKAAEALAKSAIDPLSPRATLTEAKKQADMAIQDIDRLQYAWEQLTEKSSELWVKKTKEDQLAQYSAAAGARNRVARRILEEYPDLQRKLVRLLADIAEANALCDAANKNLPDGFEPLQRPEGEVRGFHDQGSYGKPISNSTFRLTQTLLPDLENTKKAAWPPKTKEGEVQRDKVFSAVHVQARCGQKNLPV